MGGILFAIMSLVVTMGMIYGLRQTENIQDKITRFVVNVWIICCWMFMLALFHMLFTLAGGNA